MELKFGGFLRKYIVLFAVVFEFDLRNYWYFFVHVNFEQQPCITDHINTII